LNGLGYEYGALNDGGRFGFIEGGADQNIGSGNLRRLDDGTLEVGRIREDGGARSRNEIGGDERNPHRRGHRHKDKIFGLYQRFHDNVEGKGLGLFIIKSQIEATGGKIVIESEPDVGTTFIITLRQ